MLFFSIVAYSVGASQDAVNNDLYTTFSYIAPIPGAEQVSVHSTIAVRIPEMADGIEEAISFDVRGSRSGSITGTEVLARDQPRSPVTRILLSLMGKSYATIRKAAYYQTAMFPDISRLRATYRSSKSQEGKVRRLMAIFS
jgi:hypothetical protein